MRNGCKRIIWGLIFITFNLNIEIMDVIINCLGYYFMISGLSILGYENQYFKKAMSSAKILMLLSIPVLLCNSSQKGVNLSFLQRYYPYNYIYIFICSFVQIYFIYHLSIGFRDLCVEKGKEDRAKSFINCFKFYVLADVLILIVLSFYINFNNKDTSNMLIWLYILQVAININLMILISRCKSLEEND